MASVSSESWNSIIDDIPTIDDSLLMDLLEDFQVDESEEERLGCVIRSLEAEIESNAPGTNGPVAPDRGNHDDCMTVGLEDGHDCSISSCRVDGLFDWADIDMVTDSPCSDMGNWYLDACTDEIGMVGYGEVRENSHYYYADSTAEQPYSPLWQGTYDSTMYG